MKGLTLSLSEYVRPEDIRAVAVQAPGIPSYTLLHFVNKELGWELCHTRQYYRPDPDSPFESGVFSYAMEIERVRVFLLENRNERGCWIRDAPDVDYWLMLTGSGLEFFAFDDFMKALASVSRIFYCYPYPWILSARKGAASRAFACFQDLYMELDARGLVQPLR